MIKPIFSSVIEHPDIYLKIGGLILLAVTASLVIGQEMKKIDEAEKVPSAPREHSTSTQKSASSDGGVNNPNSSSDESDPASSKFQFGNTEELGRRAAER